MIKNQLSIYRKFATQQIIFERTTQEIEIPVSPKVKSENITCSESFTIQENKIKIFSRDQSKQTEIIIHYPNLSWKSHYQLFKCTSILKCYASIENETDFDFQTNDIKLMFRSIDHEYQPKETINNKGKDIPTLETKNILEYRLDLPENFILSRLSNLFIWEQFVDHEEIYQVNIMDEYSSHADAYLTFVTKEILLPGSMEILTRSEMNDLISLGGMDIKLYHRNDKMKIYFPENKFIKLKPKMDKKSHSFFLSKKLFHYSCKIKSKSDSNKKIHFYLNSNGIQNFSEEPKYKEGNIYIWEIEIKNTKKQHKDQHKEHNKEHNNNHNHSSHCHNSCNSHSHARHTHKQIANSEEIRHKQGNEEMEGKEIIFQLDFYKE